MVPALIAELFNRLDAPERLYFSENKIFRVLELLYTNEQFGVFNIVVNSMQLEAPNKIKDTLNTERCYTEITSKVFIKALEVIVEVEKHNPELKGQDVEFLIYDKYKYRIWENKYILAYFLTSTKNKTICDHLLENISRGGRYEYYIELLDTNSYLFEGIVRILLNLSNYDSISNALSYWSINSKNLTQYILDNLNNYSLFPLAIRMNPNMGILLNLHYLTQINNDEALSTDLAENIDILLHLPDLFFRLIHSDSAGGKH